MLAAVVLGPALAAAETLGDVLRARHLAPPPGAVPLLDRPVEADQVLDDARDVLVVHVTAGPAGAAALHATRLHRASGRWSAAPIRWGATLPGGPPPALDLYYCRPNLDLERVPGGFLIRAHINPSAECTVVLGEDLSVRAVLGGWPEVALPDGRIVYQRNQVHFAPVHPLALGLFDPRRGRDLTLYPREPMSSLRAAHVERMRAAYTEPWCRAHNHSCDPREFDERLAGDVAGDAGGDALAFVVAWSDTVAETEVVCVYAGLRRPGTVSYREMRRADFEARFGTGLPARALDPAVLRALFPARAR